MDRGFSLGFFVLTFLFLYGKNEKLGLFVFILTASLFLFTYDWRLYYLQPKEKTITIIETVILCGLIISLIIELLVGKNLFVYIFSALIGIVINRLYGYFFNKKKIF